MSKMKNLSNLKKATCLFLVALVGVGACSCGSTGKKEPEETPKEEAAPNYSLSEYQFTSVYTNGQVKTLNPYIQNNPKANGDVSYDVYSNIGNNNYLRIELETDVDLVGYINYYSNKDKTKTNSEKFFVEAGSTEFVTFLDAFRAGAQGAYEKTISTVSFQNVDATKEGTFVLQSIGVNDRTINTNEYMYVSDGSTVVGTSAFYGGCITYLEKLDQDVCEYMDSDGNICIDRDVDPDSVARLSSEKVNLINIMDLGREVQPSYYSAVGKENGYDPVYNPDETYEGVGSDEPIYNPIQCGDFGGHSPQIIDFQYESDRLYIKMKGQEWFFSTNVQANGYIESTYYFDKNGSLIVDNRYTDFSQFINEYDVSIKMQETPATYFVYPFNYFYCETKMGEIFDKNVGEINGRSVSKHSKNHSVTGDYVYDMKGKTVKNGWCAFVNENKFGVGIYMPNADKYVASRGRKSTNYFSEEGNTIYYDTYFQFGEDELIPSYAVFNYSYINPSLERRMIQFVPLEYSYALYVGDTKEMGTAFAQLKEEGILTNDHLTNDETKGWPDY